MKFAVIALIANVSAVALNKPLIHPQTGLAITTTGQHWYGQPPLAMAEEEPKAAETAADKKGAPAADAEKAPEDAQEDLNIYSASFRGPGHLFPLKPGPPAFKVKFPVAYDRAGYTDPEKVHILLPASHMEVSNLDSTYKFPRTAFYLQTDAELNTNQDKLEKIQRFEGAKGKDVGPDGMGGYVHDFVKANTAALPHPCRAINDKGEMP